TNTGSSAFAAGDSFKLFGATSDDGAFSNVAPAGPGPGLGGDTSNWASNGTLKVIAQAIRNGPVLPAQTNLTMVGLATLLVTHTATDNDIPATLLTYILAQAPTNAVIDTNGIITWAPVVAQVPSTNLFQIVVTDSGSPPLSATNSFTVFVRP